jgi:hypothetical protein
LCSFLSEEVFLVINYARDEGYRDRGREVQERAIPNGHRKSGDVWRTELIRIERMLRTYDLKKIGYQTGVGVGGRIEVGNSKQHARIRISARAHESQLCTSLKL